jgi:hypothetical protein
VRERWRRGETLVAVDLSDAPATIDSVHGRVALGTVLDREGEVTRPLGLEPAEGAVVLGG